MHKKQIENLLKKSANERYDYFVRYCADFEEVWGLVVENDEWITFKDKEGDEIFPLWPHSELAEECCFQEHRSLGATPQPITLDSFIENCIPDMADNKIYFGIFYDKNREGLVIDGVSLQKAIEEEVENTWE